MAAKQMYKGKEVTVEPLPKDDPRHAGNPNELVIVTDVDGAEHIVDKAELEQEAKVKAQEAKDEAVTKKETAPASTKDASKK